MPNSLVLTVRFLQPLSHGRGDGGEPEWPPSPLRLLQALVAASAAYWNERLQLEYAAPALQWLESLQPPDIVAATGITSDVRTQFYVPDNIADDCVPKWRKGDASASPKRVEKVVRPVHLLGEALHYLFALPDEPCPHLEILRTAARSITHLGWGIDMAVGDAAVLDAEQAAQLDGVRWHPSSAGGTPLRVPKAGTLEDLTRKHADFLNRITVDGFRPVPPLRMFDIVRYRRDTDPLPCPHTVFKLVDENDDTVTYPHAKFIHIAGMVRHLAIKLMKSHPPRDLRGRTPEQWIEQFVAGHKATSDHSPVSPHAQLSYIPLPSAGFTHTDPAVRRVMIVAPLGDAGWLDHLAQRLEGPPLEPLPGTTLPSGTHLQLIPENRKDGVRDAYMRESRAWASFTPVILPGHDDRKPEKTRKLILKALAQSGIDQPCEFEWSAFSHFPKSYSAHKYVRDENANDGKRRIGYIRPDHLLHQTAVHLVLRFGHREAPHNPESCWIPAEHPMPGPIAIGAGRHCGFGLMVSVRE